MQDVAATVHHGRVTTAVRAPELERLRDLVGRGGVVVLSGAGLSTESGIPDYRGPTGALRRHGPMTYQEFVGSAASRGAATGHAATSAGARSRAPGPTTGTGPSRPAAAGLVDGIITQNVDGLHQAAGGRDVIELHGGLDLVVCLSCGSASARTRWTRGCARPTPRSWPPRRGSTRTATSSSPTPSWTGSCPSAAGTARSDLLKPDVVFFGENVPRARVDPCYRLVEQARSLLVLGSSLTVMSGLRFVRRAAALGVPVAIVNQGETRGDPLAEMKIEAPLGEVLPALV